MSSISPRSARLFCAAALVACGKSTTPNATSVVDGSRVGDAGVAAAPRDPVIDDLWARARSGGEDDLARLADRVGESGLRARAEEEPALRLVALKAMAFAPEPGAFVGLPLLAQAARGANEGEATAALDSAIDLAARPRRAIDPEDAAEMKEGCDALLALAKDAKAAQPRRVKAVRALRMLADRGCVDPTAIPPDLDAR